MVKNILIVALCILTIGLIIYGKEKHTENEMLMLKLIQQQNIASEQMSTSFQHEKKAAEQLMILEQRLVSLEQKLHECEAKP